MQCENDPNIKLRYFCIARVTNNDHYIKTEFFLKKSKSANFTCIESLFYKFLCLAKDISYFNGENYFKKHKEESNRIEFFRKKKHFLCLFKYIAVMHNVHFIVILLFRCYVFSKRYCFLFFSEKIKIFIRNM